MLEPQVSEESNLVVKKYGPLNFFLDFSHTESLYQNSLSLKKINFS